MINNSVNIIKPKIIISHDVDHLYNVDHIFDSFFIKLYIRSLLEYIKGEITIKTLFSRFESAFHKRMNRIQEVMELDLSFGIPSTFFFGMNQAKGMNYSVSCAVPYIEILYKNGFDVGVHGVAYKNYKEMFLEYKGFMQLSGNIKFGIRMHYLRMDDYTLKRLSEIGYLFDSTEYSIKPPYKINNMWEFPLTIMDGYIINKNDLESTKKNTIQILTHAETNKCSYISILFHDIFFDSTYRVYMEWYKWLLDYLYNNKYSFISYKQAINDLNNQGAN